ncbi:hypothetical protein [Paenibacillus pini]|uniref:hypothetical protein n=1 Tax=Paenibacillus pini TaxID=669461 RepID=UPI0012E1C602|nr:hypothetical protein [Paenibacillus pini]
MTINNESASSRGTGLAGVAGFAWETVLVANVNSNVVWIEKRAFFSRLACFG